MADFSVDAIDVKPVSRDEEKLYESTVLIKKNGGTSGPIPIMLKFADGATITKVWEGDESHIQYTEVTTAPLEWVFVDPDHTNVLDNKLINNYMLAELPNDTRTRWNLGVSKLLQGLLGALGW